MNKDIKCNVCNEVNKLPAEKDNMFCAYCGNYIELNNSNAKTQTVIIKEKDNPIRSKPVIDDIGGIKLTNRGITSFEQIIQWFTDEELEEIETLELQNNQISNLKGLNLFPKLNNLVLHNNKIELSDSDIIEINNLILRKRNGIGIHLDGNPIPNTDWVNKVEIDKIFDTYTGTIDNISIFINRKEFYPRQINSIQQTELKHDKGKCFIATATMGSYEDPLVMELREFRDNWILSKTWGKRFVLSYYKYGSVAARYIQNSDPLKRLSFYFIIKPLLSFSRMVKRI